MIAHDSAGSDQFDLTHEFLAMMLGLQRVGVSIAAKALQRSGLISYSRGWVTIEDRRGLEDCTCECYGTIRDLTYRLLGEPKKRKIYRYFKWIDLLEIEQTDMTISLIFGLNQAFGLTGGRCIVPDERSTKSGTGQTSQNSSDTKPPDPPPSIERWWAGRLKTPLGRALSKLGKK
ncbi:Crp/Fnr family transcriptional regulator [Hyphomicrobium sp. DY-1]|uniref:Crp/Fnr family transcriptional regulator n=1 Tax=Hyphomicrobium sp. DY-1 TaxID=3075650 RepID=UPI0039C49D41